MDEIEGVDWPVKTPREPLAVRQLTWHDGNAERDVFVRVWQPIRFGGHFVCDVAIDGLPKPIRYEAFGFDPLQALTAALQRLWHALAPYRESIAWLGHRGEHGLPFAFGPLLWPVEQRRLEQLVQSEIERCNETSLQPANRWEKSLREKYDPEADDAENDGSSTAELVERLREASVRARTHRVAGNDDGTFAFESKMRTILECCVSGRISPRLSRK